MNLNDGPFLQFFPEDPHRVMITSANSKVWILDGLDVIHKYKGST